MRAGKDSQLPGSASNQSLMDPIAILEALARAGNAEAIAELVAEVNRLNTALHKFGVHDRCCAYAADEDYDCDCGFCEALNYRPE